MEYLLLYENTTGHFDVVYHCEEEEKDDRILEFEHFKTFNGDEKKTLFVYELSEMVKGLSDEK